MRSMEFDCDRARFVPSFAWEELMADFDESLIDLEVPIEQRLKPFAGIVEHLRGVEYVLVGGAAAIAHGCPTVTRDYDIVPQQAEENLARLARCLTEIGAYVREPRGSGRRPPATRELLGAVFANRGNLLLNSNEGPLDILTQLHDGRRFEDIPAQVLGMVRVIEIGTLIDLKRAIGRPRDLLVLPYLEEIRRRG